MKTSERSPAQPVWDYFCSLKLTMFLLLTLAVTSIIGTVIPQGAPPPEYLQTIGENKFKLYKALGFFDMYHSGWFILLLALLTSNLIACSIKRLPQIWRLITRPTTVMDEGVQKSLSLIDSVSVHADRTALKEKSIALLRAEFAEPVVTEADGSCHLFAQKTPWCRLAVYIVHLSIIVIFVGAIIGSLFGYKAHVNIIEGEAVTSVMSRAGKEIPLDFAIGCEQFSVSYYDTGAPKEFKSILTVLEDRKPVPGFTRIPIIVNDPLTYKGITFYQSSYGKVGEHHFIVSNRDGSNKTSLTVDSSSSARLPDGSGMHVLESTQDVSPFQPGMSGPAAHIEIHTPAGETKAVVIYSQYPELNARTAQQNGLPLISYTGGQEQEYTGLQVVKDPGVWVVWLGCFLMVAGVYAAFFMSHRRVWIRISDDEVTIGGHSNKNPAGFQPVFARLVERLRNDISGEGEK